MRRESGRGGVEEIKVYIHWRSVVQLLQTAHRTVLKYIHYSECWGKLAGKLEAVQNVFYVHLCLKREMACLARTLFFFYHSQAMLFSPLG